MAQGAMALERFKIHPEGRHGRYVEVECRRRGLRGLIRAALGLDVHVSLDVDADHIQFRDEGLFRESYHTIPITAVRGVTGGFMRPLGKLMMAFGLALLSLLTFVTAILVAADALSPDLVARADKSAITVITSLSGVGVLLAAGVMFLLYARQKRLFLEFEYGGKAPVSIVLQRSWKRLIDLDEVRRAIAVINGLILDAHRVEDESGPVVVLSDRATEAAAAGRSTAG